MNCCQHHSVGRSRPAERFFAVGPVRELGGDLGSAVLQLGGDTQQSLNPAHGYVVVSGRGFGRLPQGIGRADARARVRGSYLRLGEAVGLVGEKVIYREVSGDTGPITKVIDPLSEQGFLRTVDRIARALRGVSKEAEADAVRRAIERLDVDWPNLSARGRAQVVRAANQALSNLPAAILPGVDEVLGVESRRVVLGTRSGVKRKFGLKIDADLSRTDERIARFVSESQSNFIRDELGRRQAALSQRARDIASEGIKQGLGRDAIAGQLRDAFRSTTANRNAFYWDVVASAFVNRARSLAEVSSYADAGISHYIISAVLDEVTTDICRFLDGKRMSVGTALEQFRSTERLRDPERIKVAQPWLQVRQDRSGNRAIFVPGENGPTRVAVVEESAELAGLKDERGSFRAGFGSQRLESVNVGPPPYHGLCRTTTLPEV